MLIETEFQWKKDHVEECETEIVQLRIGSIKINCGIICVLNKKSQSFSVDSKVSVILNHQNTTKRLTIKHYTLIIIEFKDLNCHESGNEFFLKVCGHVWHVSNLHREGWLVFSYHGSFQKRALWTWRSDPYLCAEQSPDGGAPPHILEPELRVEFLSVTAPVCILHLRSDSANKQMINKPQRNRSRYTHTCINWFLNPVTNIIQ